MAGKYDPELQKIYYDNNPEAYLKRSRAYYRKNRENILSKKREQYLEKRLLHENLRR